MLFPLKTDFPLAKNPHSYPKIQHHTDHPAVIPNSTPPYLERSVAESRDLLNIGSIPITQSLLSSRTHVRDLMNIGSIPITLFFCIYYISIFYLLCDIYISRCSKGEGQGPFRMGPHRPPPYTPSPLHPTSGSCGGQSEKFATQTPQF